MISRKYERVLQSVLMGILMSSVLGTYKLILMNGISLDTLEKIPLSILSSLIVSIPTSYYVGPYVVKLKNKMLKPEKSI